MKDLRRLLLGVGHVGELSRLLSVFNKQRSRALGKKELIELASQTAGAGYRYPTPRSALELALEIGLLKQQNKLIALTTLGDKFNEHIPLNQLDLSIPQARLLLSLLLDDENLRDDVSALLQQFHQGAGKHLEARPASIRGGDSTERIARLLQQLHLIKYEKGLLLLDSELEQSIPIEVVGTAGLSEQALWQRVDQQRLRAQVAEEVVVEQERLRLCSNGRRDLADLVVRVSAVNVSTGYDIKSFEDDGSPRYIEVKSSTGMRVRFEWSVGERKKAEKEKKRYWIYLVRAAYSLPQIVVPILLIQDPSSHITDGRLTETASSFIVEEQKSSRTTKTQRVAVDGNFQPWPS